MTLNILIILLIVRAPAGNADPPQKVLADFAAENLPDHIRLHDAEMTRVAHEGSQVREVRFGTTEWPNVFFEAPEGGWDFSQWAGIAVELHNPGETALAVNMRVDNPGADGTNHCNTAHGHVRPAQDYVLRCRFNTGASDVLWGMRGVPVLGPVGSGPQLDTANITAWQVYLPQPDAEHTIVFKKAWLFGLGGDIKKLIDFPFVDRFGQYIHDDWPGKLHGEDDYPERRAAEAVALAQAGALPDRDACGGWKAGRKREATGWFRTEKVDGKWWLVTPTGYLFFSNGADCVGTWSQTFVEKRGDWFAWLPEEGAPLAKFYGQQKNAHSGAEPIGGEGRTFNFYAANLRRKYGDGWQEHWRHSSYKRLAAWGFNTIGNWSQADVLEHSPLPYVVAAGSPHVPAIEGATGYWAKMKDVYHPDFAKNAAKHLAWTKRHADNPLCIGFFSDNELAWEDVARGTLASPPEQPCRKVFITRLQKTYTDLDALNRAWDVDAASWDTLRAPESAGANARKDLDAFLHAFATRYFTIMRDALRANAPNHLYLGCRFSTAPEPVVQACAEVADVVSFNIYRRTVPQDAYNQIDAPVLIGEFHFGARDRGMFHTGLVPVASQAERAQCYIEYVESAARHPNVVGCHWFQYVDEPITGRWFDGENYNIGFVDVTDTPYPELVEAARQVHERVYAIRARGKPPQ